MDPQFPYLDESAFFLFPPVESATPEGIVAVEGNLSPGMILSAYRQGIFPWFNEDDPILWWSPDPRFVLLPEKLHVSRSMKKIIKKNIFSFSSDHAFFEVIFQCAEVRRMGEEDTWIHDEIISAYSDLHRLGYAHSLEVREDGILAGGLYGVRLGNIFFGESMFSVKPNASKAGFIVLVTALRELGYVMIDCQVPTRHLLSLGAEAVPRTEFLSMLEKGLAPWKEKKPWPDDSTLAHAAENLV